MSVKSISKALSILTLTALMSTSAFASESEALSYTDEYIEANTIYSDDGAVMAELSDAEPQKLIYNKYTFGSNIESDIPVGNMTYYNATGGNDEALIKVNPDEYGGTSWISSFNFDSVGIHTELDGVPCFFTTKYIRNNGKGSTSPGYVYLCMGEDVTTEDKSFIVEVEAYDNNKSNLTVRYVSSYNDQNKAVYKTISKAREATNTWKTFTYEINDACFNGEYSTGLANGTSDFRIEVASADTYIKSITVYNSKDYEALYSGLDLLDPDFTAPIEDNFTLPSLDGFDIEWSSSDEETVYIDGDTACILPDYTEKTAILTAKLIKDGYYAEKKFEITLKALEKKTIEFSDFNPVESESNGAVGVDIANGRNYSGKIMLFALAADKTTGEIKAIGMDTFVGGTANEARLDASVPLGSNQEFKYCLLDSKGASLANNPPSKPSNLRYSAGFESLELIWDKSYDDYDSVKKYEVTLDGEILGETENELSYPVDNLTTGNEYNLSVKAYDHMGKASEPAVLDIVFPRFAQIDLGDPENSDGLSMLINENIGSGDSYTEEYEINGIRCRKNVDRTVVNGKSRTWLYFKTDKEIISSEDNTVTIEITYIDTGKKNMVLQYNATDGSPAKSVVVAKSFGNTNELKTATVTINDAMFSEHSSLTRCDFRLGSDQAGGEVYIVKVRAVASK